MQFILPIFRHLRPGGENILRKINTYVETKMDTEYSTHDIEKQHIGSLFDRIATTYDSLNHILSFGIDRYWRYRAVKGMQSSDRVLDVAIGTADLSLEMIRSLKAKQIVGIDLSDEMMHIGERKCAEKGYNISFVHANAQKMPFADKSFDAVTCAYGCRNFSNLSEGLSEMYRVMVPGGELMILEFSYPSNPLIRVCYDFYFSRILPIIGKSISRDKNAYSYLNASVKGFRWGEDFVCNLREAGFSDISYETLTWGITTIYRAHK